jgi:hypothetical protein
VIATTHRSRRRLGRTVGAALGLSLALAAQTAPAGASGAESLHFSFKGQTAEARFYSQQGCVATEAFVHAVDGRIKTEPGRPDALSSVFVAVGRFDICTHQRLDLSLGFRENLDDALHVDRLDAASLVTTVQMTNLTTGATYPMDLQLQWTGIGEPFTAREHIKLDYPGFRVNARESGTTRMANVTGVVSDGTTNYASGAWTSGTLSSVNAGQVVVLH